MQHFEDMALRRLLARCPLQYADGLPTAQLIGNPALEIRKDRTMTQNLELKLVDLSNSMFEDCLQILDFPATLQA
ncbi:hypothetical protein Slin15195_G063750 [Septoria linicola]|uniref:Uncharacterized protein n=1 Tax=Septoria linicola TaxID=215465 RepID=A0A9Q9EIR5_9PEZI|nr:hypothetical protein Slin15195_G063750 [Septoria linicola]